jgi:outer membrane protein TolC
MMSPQLNANAGVSTARLSLQAELANDYIAARGLDTQLEVLRQSITSYQTAVEGTRLRTVGKIALRRAQLRHSWAQYAQTRDYYRATVLAAFQEVEDSLSQTQRLATEDTQEHEAGEQAAQALSISTMLYETSR